MLLLSVRGRYIVAFAETFSFVSGHEFAKKHAASVFPREAECGNTASYQIYQTEKSRKVPSARQHIRHNLPSSCNFLFRQNIKQKPQLRTDLFLA